MKNIGIVIAAVIIILIIAIGEVLFIKYSKPPTQPQTTNTQSTKTENSNSTTDSILNLLSGGKTVNCTVTNPDNKGTGTIFVSDKKFAGEFVMKDSDGKEITGHTVSDGTYIYVWSSTASTGIKMKFEDAKNTAQNAQANQGIDVNQKVGLKCSPWLPDNSKFTIPSNIKFQDMSQLLQQAQPQTTVTPQAGTGTQSGSSLCDQVPAGTARTACLNAIQSSGE